MKHQPIVGGEPKVAAQYRIPRFKIASLPDPAHITDSMFKVELKWGTTVLLEDTDLATAKFNFKSWKAAWHHHGWVGSNQLAEFATQWTMMAVTGRSSFPRRCINLPATGRRTVASTLFAQAGVCDQFGQVSRLRTISIGVYTTPHHVPSPCYDHFAS